MRFAAGLTVTGIVGFLLMEVLKLILPTLGAWVLALLAITFKILLVGVALMLGLGAIGLAIFLYTRSRKSRAEA